MRVEGYFSSLNKAESAVYELERNGIRAHLDLDRKFMDSGNNIRVITTDFNGNRFGEFDKIINKKHKVVVETDNGNRVLAIQIIEKVIMKLINFNYKSILIS